MADLLTRAPSVGVFAGDPNGSVSAAKGSLLRDSTNGKLWVNTTGSTVWVDQAASSGGGGGPGDFGNGSDGPATFDGTTTVAGMVPSSGQYRASRSYQFSDVTFSGGTTFFPDGHEHFCNGVMSGTGVSDTSGGNAQAPNAFGSTGGAAPFSGVRPLPNGGKGGTASNSGNTAPDSNLFAVRGASTATVLGGASSPAAGQNGGVLQGGGGGAGAAGGGSNGGLNQLAEVARNAPIGDWQVPRNAAQGTFPGATVIAAAGWFTCTSGGGPGGNGGGGRQPGGGGGGGGWQTWHIRNLSSTNVTFRSKGGNGQTGQTDGIFGAGGGGAGPGGIVVLFLGTGSVTPTIDVSPGTPGSAGGGATAPGGPGGSAGSGLSLVYTP